MMDADQLARWLRDEALTNTGVQYGPILTNSNVSDFDIRMPDGTEANVRIEIQR
jgi:hypothetical protein